MLPNISIWKIASAVLGLATLILGVFLDPKGSFSPDEQLFAQRALLFVGALATGLPALAASVAGNSATVNAMKRINGKRAAMKLPPIATTMLGILCVFLLAGCAQPVTPDVVIQDVDQICAVAETQLQPNAFVTFICSVIDPSGSIVSKVTVNVPKADAEKFNLKYGVNKSLTVKESK